MHLAIAGGELRTDVHSPDRDRGVDGRIM